MTEQTPYHVAAGRNPGEVIMFESALDLIDWHAPRPAPAKATPPEELRVFVMGPDHVVARDVEDAWSIWCSHYDEEREPYESAGEVPELVPDDEHLTVLVDEHGQISDSGNLLRLTAREWVSREGRGFLCSSEY